MQFTDQLLQLFTVSQLLPTCAPTEPVEAVFVYSRSHEPDGRGLLETAVSLCRQGLNRGPIVVNGGTGVGCDGVTPAWPGRTAYLERLKILDGSAEVLTTRVGGLHTREESIELFDMIEKHGWKRVAVVNTVHYMLRTMLGVLSEVNKRKVPIDSIRIFPVCANPVDWLELTSGSQGRPSKPRIVQCEEELSRICYYFEKFPDNYVSINELIDYLTHLNRPHCSV